MARLVVLSCGVPTPMPGRWGTAFALQVGQETLLVDCGPAATLKLYQAGLRATDVSRVFFTHLHSDHMADFPCFLMTRFDMSIGGETPLQVYGPPPPAGRTRILRCLSPTVRCSTSSKSPRTGAEKAARPAMLTVVSSAMPARMTPPKIASQRAIR